jgi:MFS family permease
VGGFIVTTLSWRWIFDINVPIGLLGLVLASLFIPDVREDNAKSLDVRGSLISGAALSCLVLGLELTGRGLDARLGIWLLIATVPLIAAYWLHARRHPDPVLDLGLLRVPSFAISVASGSLYRVAMGAQPFLLPLMLQIGFGMSAATSGGITFVGAVGAMCMRAVAPRALRRWGFRKVLVVNGVIAVLLFAVEALFRPSWPILLIYLTLLVGGFSAAMQFTAYNTIAFADVSSARMSAATSLYATCQQVCLTLGIIAAATSLAVSRYASGHSALSLGNFSVAFLLVSVIGLLAPLISLRFAPDAGDELRGR